MVKKICGIGRVDGVRNTIIREGYELSVLERIERKVLKWFEHAERLVKRMYQANVKGNRGRGRLQRKWRMK